MKPLRAFLLASTFTALGSAAGAGIEAVSVSNCGDLEYGQKGQVVTTCDVRNHSDAPISAIEATVILQSPKGAAVTRISGQIGIPGGIAPGDMQWVSFPHARNASEFVGTPFVTVVDVLRAVDYDGADVRQQTAESFDDRFQEHVASVATAAKEVDKPRSEAPKPTPEKAPAPARHSGKLDIAASERLEREIKECWRVNPRSDIAEVDLVVTFDLDEDAQLKGDVEVLRSTDYDEKVVWDAYMAVRRAILRCQGDGFAVQGPVQGIKMRFSDGANARVVG